MRPQVVKYKFILEELLKLYPEKNNAYYTAMMKQTTEKGTTNVDPKKDPTQQRRFQELTSANDLKYNCLGKEVCAIGLIPSGKENDDKKKMLQNLDIMAEKAGKNVFYSWIDATCHSYILKMFGIEAGSLPNVVFYKPSA